MTKEEVDWEFIKELAESKPFIYDGEESIGSDVELARAIIELKKLVKE